MTDRPIRIQRKRTKGWRMPEDTVYVGRPSRWGNPFYAAIPRYSMSRVGTTPQERREVAVSKFRSMLAHRADRSARGYPADLGSLRGMNLACWCSLDQPCHADVLLELANAPDHGSDQ